MAGRIPDKFIEDLKAALPASEVVRRRIPDLKRAGSEWKCLSPFNKEKTPSFTVNDSKSMWYDFSSGVGGNIIDFEMKMTGCTFVEAVRDLAALAGLAVPGDNSPARPTAARTTVGLTAPPQDEPDDPGPGFDAPAALSSQRKTTAIYDYTDADGGLIYQACRVEWLEKGERKKTFVQRRPAWGADTGRWIWGLKAGTYVQGRDGDFWILTKPRESWDGRRLDVADDVPHMLYRMAALGEEMTQDASERRVVFTPEGEKDCDTLDAWGLLATDSSGGSKVWSPHHAEMLRGADVVVLADNDKSGRGYAHTKAGSLRGIAARVRVLDWGDPAVWPNAPPGADVTDWRDHAGGTAARLWAMVDALPDWTPQPPESAFGAVRWLDLDKPARELEWLIKGILTRGEVSIWYGAPGCGKSFLLTDAAMAIARGLSWLGQRVRSGLSIYQAGEGGLGLKRRLRAYRRHHHMPAADDIPFVLLPSRVDLFANDADVDKLITEIKAWASFYDAPLELVAIDTFSAASPGADENAGKDVGPVLARCRRIADETGAHVALVHHVPKNGMGPRGWSGFMGNVDNGIEIVRTEETDQQLDGDRIIKRDIRKITVTKQKDGEDGLARSFVLRQVVLGADGDGDPITSCVVAPLDFGHAADRMQASTREVPRGWHDMKPNNRMIMRALVKALAEHGRPTPLSGMHAPDGTRVCTIGEWINALAEIRFSNDPEDPPVDKFQFGRRLYISCKKAVERTYSVYDWNGKQNLIGKDREYIWRTGRQVVGVDRAPDPIVQRPEQGMLLAPGEDSGDISDVLH